MHAYIHRITYFSNYPKKKKMEEKYFPNYTKKKKKKIRLKYFSNYSKKKKWKKNIFLIAQKTK